MIMSKAIKKKSIDLSKTNQVSPEVTDAVEYGVCNFRA